MSKLRYFILKLICLLWIPWAATAQVHHALDVTLRPDTATIEVRDTITLPEGHPSSLTFALHSALQPQLQGEQAKLTELPAQLPGVRFVKSGNRAYQLIGYEVDGNAIIYDSSNPAPQFERLVPSWTPELTR